MPGRKEMGGGGPAAPGRPRRASGSLRRIAGDLAIYGSGDLVLRASALLTLPVYARVFTAEEYGTWSFLVTLTFLLAATLILGGDTAFGRFFLAARTDDDRRRITSTLLLLAGGGSALVVACLLPVSPILSEWAFGARDQADLVALSLAVVPLMIANTVLGQALRNEFRPVPYAVLNVATAAAAIAISLYLILARDQGVAAVLIGALVANAGILPIRAWTARHLLGMSFSRTSARRVLVFGLPLVPAAIAGWALTFADRIVIAKLASLRELGLYAVATAVAAGASFLLAPLWQAWWPHAVASYERDPDAAAVLHGRVLTYVMLMFGAVAVALAAFADELVQVVATSRYAAAAAAVGPLALAAFARATVPVTSAGILLRDRTRYVAVLTGTWAAGNVALAAILVPPFGMLGAAWAAAAASTGLTISYAAVSHRLWRVRYEARRAATVATLTLVFVVGAPALPDLAPAAEIALGIAYLAAFVSVLFAAGAAGRRETAAARLLLRGRSIGADRAAPSR